MGNSSQRAEQAAAAGKAAAEAVLQQAGASDGSNKNSGIKPELIYFAGPGRGELARLAFVAGGVDFTDTRIPMADWPAIKGDSTSVPAQLFGQMPCIKHGDALIAQSQAVAVYAAEQGIWAQGRLGNCAEMATNAASEMMVAGAHAQVQSAMYSCLFGDDESKAKGKEALPGAVKPVLDGLESMYARGNSGGAFLFCQSGPTLADLAVHNMINSPFPGLKALGFDMGPYPKLCAAAEAVSKDAYIAAYERGKPELIYFDAPGRAQLIRLTFAAGKVDFTDTRIKGEDWPALKQNPESVPAKCFGQMPCIKHGEMMVAQSQACATYAAQLGIWKSGRLGATPSIQSVNRATEVMALGAHSDVQGALYKCNFGDEESKKNGKEALPGAVKSTLDGLERALARKGSTTAFFFCDTGPTLADIAVYDALSNLKKLEVDLEAYPKLRAVADAVAEDDGIKAYNAKQGS